MTAYTMFAKKLLLKDAT